jgi:hypothetical protein
MIWIYILIVFYLWIPIVVTRLYKFLNNKRIWFFNLIIALSLIPLFFKFYNINLSLFDRGAILLLWSPLIFLLLFKILNTISVKLNKRYLNLANRFTLLKNEAYNAWDMLSFVLLLIVPFSIPMLIRELNII